MVEPILLYNCEIAQACIPNNWDQGKFKDKMWDDREIDKVLKGFLRQVLGVSKKTTVITAVRSWTVTLFDPDL